MSMRDHLDGRPGTDLVTNDAAALERDRRGGALDGADGLLHLVGSVFSWQLGEHVVPACGDLYTLGRGLLLYARLSGREVGAKSRTRAAALRQRGLSRLEIRDLWQIERGKDSYEATLPFDLLFDVFEPPVWEALAILITDGPAQASQTIDRLLYEQAARTVKPTGARPSGGRLSRSTLNSYASPLTWVMRTLVDLQQKGFPCTALEAWRYAPKLHLPTAPEANTDRSSSCCLTLRPHRCAAAGSGGRCVCGPSSRSLASSVVALPRPAPCADMISSANI